VFVGAAVADVLLGKRPFQTRIVGVVVDASIDDVILWRWLSGTDPNDGLGATDLESEMGNEAKDFRTKDDEDGKSAQEEIKPNETKALLESGT
jgi:hypothetical protein